MVSVSHLRLLVNQVQHVPCNEQAQLPLSLVGPLAVVTCLLVLMQTQSKSMKLKSKRGTMK